MITGRKIIDEENNGEYIVFESRLVENVNPIEYFQELCITSNFGVTHSFLKKSLEYKNLYVSEEAIAKFSLKEATENWKNYFSEIQSTIVPTELLLCVEAQSKKDQVKLLRNVVFSADILLAFTFNVWEKYCYKFSRYISEHHPNGTDKNELPKSAYLNNGKIDKVGKTNLTDGQIKQVIENRKVIVANFFDNEKNWFCLFVTYDSLKGKEGWKNGTPHYHFISDKFGITKKKVIEQLQSKEYKLGNLPHIETERRDIE